MWINGVGGAYKSRMRKSKIGFSFFRFGIIDPLHLGCRTEVVPYITYYFRHQPQAASRVSAALSLPFGQCSASGE